jgi:hypothetical protein
MKLETVPIDKIQPAKYNPRKDLKPDDSDYEKLNRKCYMMEIDNYYASVVIERWTNFTGKEAELLT